MIETATEAHIAEVHHELPDRIIEQNHYLQSTPAGAKHRYLITDPLREVIGAALWGRPVARNEDQEDTLELTRFWTKDSTPKNTESYCLAAMIRELQENGYERFIAYASTGQDHDGSIYKATNWQSRGERPTSSWENREGRTDRDTSDKIKFVKEVDAS